MSTDIEDIGNTLNQQKYDDFSQALNDNFDEKIDNSAEFQVEELEEASTSTQLNDEKQINPLDIKHLMIENQDSLISNYDLNLEIYILEFLNGVQIPLRMVFLMMLF